jgi:hypothetical protein
MNEQLRKDLEGCRKLIGTYEDKCIYCGDFTNIFDYCNKCGAKLQTWLIAKEEELGFLQNITCCKEDWKLQKERISQLKDEIRLIKERLK